MSGGSTIDPRPAILRTTREDGARSDGESALQGRLRDECYARVLPGEAIGPDSDFFELGGSSIQVMRLLALVRERLGVEVPVLEFLRRPTLAVLAELVERAGAGALRAGDPLPRVPRHGPLPLSYAQQRLWFLDQLAGDRAAYNVGEAYRLRGPLDVAALGRALDALVARHEPLRTRFGSTGGVPYQVVEPTGSLPLDGVDLRADPGSLDALLAARLAEPFDLAAGRPARATLVALGPDDHVLCLVLHHIVTDGRSTEVLLTELSELYTAFAEGRGSPLPPPPVQYADYAVWQRQWLDDGARDRDLAYWREQLADAPAEVELPSDRPRPPVARHRGATIRVEVPPAVAALLPGVARAAGATPFMVLLAGFTALLARYSRTRDIVVGASVDNRHRSELVDTVGIVTNTLALRTDCSGDPTFRELVERVRATALAAYAHQQVPFEEVVDATAAGRDLGRNPVVQVTFEVCDALEDFVRLPGVTVEPVLVPGATSRFDLSLAVLRSGEALTAAVNYDTDLFDRDTVERIAGHLGRVWAAALTDPDRRLRELDPMSAEERHAVTVAVNDTGGTPRCTVPELVARQVAQRPAASAVVHEGGVLSYRELAAESGRLARHLLALGVRRGDHVAVALERGAELVALLLAILELGAAYVPVDPAYPGERIRFMLDDSGTRHLLTRRRLLDRLPPGVPAVCLDDLPPDPPEAVAPAEPVDPDDAAYLMYTSGSTGRPKGVVVTQRAVVDLVLGLDVARLTPDDAVLFASAVAFDASTFEIWAPLAHGGRIAVHPAGPPDPRALGTTIARHGVTVAFLTAQYTNLVADTEPACLSGLRLLLSGGEAMSVPHVRRLAAALPDTTICNIYGPTETTTFATVQPLTPAMLAAEAPVPIGRPLRGTRAYVLDPDLDPVPFGVVGALYLGGSGLARGYHRRPALTAERFVPDPFGPPGQRLYATGDLVRRRRDGAIDFMGRVDDQVKLRGFRIEPGEVTAALTRHPLVREAFVTVVGRNLAAQLVAYVVPAEGARLDASVLRAHLRERLPDYLVPSAYVLMPALPMTAIGKVDRRALPHPATVAGAETPAPETPAERLVAEVWGELLGRARVGRHDDFFELGGNSLLATQAVARLSARLGAPVALTDMFRRPSVAELAAGLVAEAVADADEPAGPAGPAEPAEPAGGAVAGPLTPGAWPGPSALAGGAPVPLSPAQQRLWLLHEMLPDPSAYNVPFLLRLSGPLDVDALRAAIAAVVDRHEVLRSGLVRGPDGRPVQVVEAAPDIPLPVVDVTDSPGGEAARLVEEVEAAAARQPFDLARPPLLRAHLVRTAPTEHRLSLTFHHVAFDGWSVAVFLDELAAYYEAALAGRQAALPPLPVQYGDYAAWQWRRSDSGAFGADLAYWRDRLAGLPTVDLVPPDRPRPRRLSGAGSTRRLALLTPAELDQIDALARRHRATTRFVVLLAAFQATIAARGGPVEFGLGIPVSGRERPELMPLVGFFVNMLVLRADLTGDPDFTEVLRRTRDGALDAFAHQAVPFDAVVAELRPPRRLDRAPLVSVVFSLDDVTTRPARLGPVAVAVEGIHTGIAKYDLDVVVRRDDGLACVVDYSTDLYGAGTVERLVDDFRRVLLAVVADPGRRISELGKLPPAESAEAHRGGPVER